MEFVNPSYIGNITKTIEKDIDYLEKLVCVSLPSVSRISEFAAFPFLTDDVEKIREMAIIPSGILEMFQSNLEQVYDSLYIMNAYMLLLSNLG